MADKPPKTATRRRRRILIAVGILGLIVIAVLLGVGVYLFFSGHDTTGLEGTWHFANDPRHSYEFLPNGELASWFGSKQWWNGIGWSATWRRDGDRISIRTDRNWDFEGELDGGTIRGKMLMRDPNGAGVSEVDLVWQRE
jgi:hypothetical protein